MNLSTLTLKQMTRLCWGAGAIAVLALALQTSVQSALLFYPVALVCFAAAAAWLVLYVVSKARFGDRWGIMLSAPFALVPAMIFILHFLVKDWGPQSGSYL